MGNKKIRVGVVGVGYLGRLHAQKYAAAADVDLVGVADIDADRAAEVAKQNGTQPFATTAELLAQKVDAISVVVPTNHHHAIACEAIRAGVDVLVEKPFTVTLEEADEVTALAKKHERILQVGHLERFNPTLTGLAGEIGNPMFVEAHRLAQFGERGTEVDVVLDLMIHDLDIVLWAVDAKVDSISGVGIPVLTDKIDIANVRIEFEGGCVANLTASRVSMQRMRKVRFFQANGYFSLDFDAKKAQVIRRTIEEPAGPTISAKEVDLASSDALADELAAFVSSVRERSTPVVTGDDGRRALEVAVRITEAIEVRLKQNAGRLPEELRR